MKKGEYLLVERVLEVTLLLVERVAEVTLLLVERVAEVTLLYIMPLSQLIRETNTMSIMSSYEKNQPAITSSTLTIETLEQGVKYFQS